MYTYSTCVRVGSTNVRIEFKDGVVTTAGITPATYTTSSIVIQRAIESSALFKGGRIKVVREFLIGETENVKKPNQAPTKITDVAVDTAEDSTAGNDDERADESEEEAIEDSTAGEEENNGVSVDSVYSDDITFPEVKNMQQAKEILETKFGVSLEELQTKASIQAKADELGVVFPNWK